MARPHQNSGPATHDAITPAPGFGVPLFNVLDYWRPGRHVTPWPDDATDIQRRNIYMRDPAEYAEYMAFMRRNLHTATLVMASLASNATPVNTMQAITYQHQARIAKRCRLSTRRLYDYLRRLAWADEIDILPCDGHACYSSHRKTPHYLVNNPPDAPIFDIAATARRTRHRTRRNPHAIPK